MAPQTGPAKYAIKKVPTESHQSGSISFSAKTLPRRSTKSAITVNGTIKYSLLLSFKNISLSYFLALYHFIYELQFVGKIFYRK